MFFTPRGLDRSSLRSIRSAGGMGVSDEVNIQALDLASNINDMDGDEEEAVMSFMDRLRIIQ